VKIAFALIAHQHPKTVERLIRLMLADGHVVAVHYDARAAEAGYKALVEAFAGNESVRVVREFHVAWERSPPPAGNRTMSIC
jgi:predicted SnoaL-like aldol condensation-catalyzing enzyme